MGSSPYSLPHMSMDESEDQVVDPRRSRWKNL